MCLSSSPGLLNRRPGGHLCWLSLLHLITNWSGPQTQSGVSRTPSAGWWLCLRNLHSNSSDLQLADLQLADFLFSQSYIIVQSPTQSPTQSLEWHVWLSSRGNNCHAVHRLLSSGASVYECTMGFFTLSHFVRQINLHDFFRLLAIGMCHFLPVHHFGMACLAGSKVNIQHFSVMIFNSTFFLCSRVNIVVVVLVFLFSVFCVSFLVEGSSRLVCPHISSVSSSANQTFFKIIVAWSAVLGLN